MLALIFGFVAGVFVGWSTAETQFAKDIREKVSNWFNSK